MAIELEFKARVDSHALIRKRLRGLGASFAGRVTETNSHFDTAYRGLLKKGCGLRIRHARDLTSRGKSPELTITYKGRMQRGAYKSREEIETTIGDHKEMVDLLNRLGFFEQIRFEKIRESWEMRIGRKAVLCKVELDEIPQLGLFVEIEAPGKAEIRACLKALKIEDAKPIRQSYVGMLAATVYKKRGTRRPLVFAFANRGKRMSKS